MTNLDKGIEMKRADIIKELKERGIWNIDPKDKTSQLWALLSIRRGQVR